MHAVQWYANYNSQQQQQMNYIAKWEEKKRDLPGLGDEDGMEDWSKLCSSPLPLFFIRFSSGLAFLCFVSFLLLLFSFSSLVFAWYSCVARPILWFSSFLFSVCVVCLFVFFFLCCSILAWAWSRLLESWRRFYSPFPLFHPASVFFLWFVLILSLLSLSLFSTLYSGSPSLFFLLHLLYVLYSLLYSGFFCFFFLPFLCFCLVDGIN